MNVFKQEKKWKGSFPKTNNMLKRPTIYSTQEEYCSLLNETWPFTCFFGRSFRSFLFRSVEKHTFFPLLKWSFEMSISTSLSTFASHLILVRFLGKSQGNNFPYFDGTHAIFLFLLYTDVYLFVLVLNIPNFYHLFLFVFMSWSYLDD